MRTKQRGGKRLGAGRIAKFATGPVKRYNLTLDDAAAQGLRDYGEGDLSAGIRRAWQHVKGCRK